MPHAVVSLPNHVLVLVTAEGGGNESCGGGPRRYLITLPEPLGSRRVWDAAVYPPREPVDPLP
jgi:hypothetical protein